MHPRAAVSGRHTIGYNLLILLYFLGPRDFTALRNLQSTEKIASIG